MGFFTVIKDWNLVRKQKEGFLAALRMTPVGACISIKDPGNSITARALIELLREHPHELEVMDFGFEVTLMRKVGMVQSMERGTYNALHANYQILDANGVIALGLQKGDQLPPRRFRDGVPDDINGKGGVDVSAAATKVDVKVE